MLLAVSLAHRKFRAVKGTLEGGELQESFQTEYPEIDLRRWFFDEPLYDEEEDQTWVVSNQWGLNTVPALEELTALAPDMGISFEPA